MSIIVAVKKQNKCVIAADGLTTYGSICSQPGNRVNNSKLIQAGNCYFGLVGWAAIQTIFEDLALKYDDLFHLKSRQQLFQSALKIHKILEEDYFIETNEEDDQPVDSSQFSGLFITENSIFDVDSYREVNEYEKFWAIGSGKQFALGSLESTYERLEDPIEIAKEAIRVACLYNDDCGFPIFTEQIFTT